MLRSCNAKVLVGVLFVFMIGVIIVACHNESQHPTSPTESHIIETEGSEELELAVAKFPAALSLSVAFQSQYETDCKKDSNNCCGIAATNMGTAYLHGVTPRAEYLKKMYQHLGLNKCCNKGTMPDQQLTVAKEIGNAKKSELTGLTWEELKKELNANHPIVIALKYSYIGNRCKTYKGNDYNGDHSVLLVGYDKEYWIVNDPLCHDSSGRRREIPLSEFEQACKDYAKRYYSYYGVTGEGDAIAVVLKK